MVRTNRQRNLFRIPGSPSWSSDMSRLLVQALPALPVQDGSSRPGINQKSTTRVGVLAAERPRDA